MDSQNHSDTFRRRRLEEQGYLGFSDDELKTHEVGIRFAYVLCTLSIILGLVLNNVWIMGFALLTALVGSFPPHHPYDYLFNSIVRHWLNKPKTPERAPQGRFACQIASVFLALIVTLMILNLTVAVYIVTGGLLVSAVLVSSTNICIPSIIYLKFSRSQEADERKDRSTNQSAS